MAASTFGADLSYNPLNQKGADVYPITSPTWMMAYAKQTSATQGAALKKFINFMLTDAQKLANGANFAALPTSLQQKAIAQLSKFQIPA